jgi:hypothetical protein
MLLQEAPANTTGFMIAGYVVIFGVMLIYLISLMIRQRNLQKDLEVLEDLSAEQG